MITNIMILVIVIMKKTMPSLIPNFVSSFTSFSFSKLPKYSKKLSHISEYDKDIQKLDT